MTYATWLTFTIMATLLVISPGPNGVIVLKTLAQHGYRPTLAVVTGLFGATFMHGLFVLFGLSALLLVIPQAFMIIKILGALYLGYLGIKSIKQFFDTAPSKQDTDDVLEQQGTLRVSNIKRNQSNKNSHKINQRRHLRTGLLAQLLNPKVSVFYLAVLPNFVDFTASTATLDTLILTTTHASIVGGWFLLVATISHQIMPHIKSAVVGRWLTGLAGAVMLYFSAMLLTYDAKKS